MVNKVDKKNWRLKKIHTQGHYRHMQLGPLDQFLFVWHVLEKIIYIYIYLRKKSSLKLASTLH